MDVPRPTLGSVTPNLFQNPTQEVYTTFPYAERGRRREGDNERRRNGTNIFVLVLRVIFDKLALSSRGENASRSEMKRSTRTKLRDHADGGSIKTFPGQRGAKLSMRRATRASRFRGLFPRGTVPRICVSVCSRCRGLLPLPKKNSPQ